MRGPIYYVVQPTAELRRLNDEMGIGHPFAEEVRVGNLRRRLGFERCFSMFEADSFAPADKLIEDAEADRERAKANLAL